MVKWSKRLPVLQAAGTGVPPEYTHRACGRKLQTHSPAAVPGPGKHDPHPQLQEAAVKLTNTKYICYSEINSL